MLVRVVLKSGAYTCMIFHQIFHLINMKNEEAEIFSLCMAHGLRGLYGAAAL